MRRFIVIPAYNEERMIVKVIRDVKQHVDEVVVVDDGSTDDTGKLVRQEGVIFLRHIINRGQGAALSTGIEYALLKGADLIITFDADGQQRASEIPGIIQPILDGVADVVIGSRFLNNKSDVPFTRKIVLKMAVLFTWIFSGVKLTDAHNGFRALSRQAAEKIKIRQNRMAHASEIIHEIVRQKLRLKEIPVTIQYTHYSRGKGQVSLDAFKIAFDLLVGKFV